MYFCQNTIVTPLKEGESVEALVVGPVGMVGLAAMDSPSFTCRFMSSILQRSNATALIKAREFAESLRKGRRNSNVMQGY
jgi:hypothetical protein